MKSLLAVSVPASRARSKWSWIQESRPRKFSFEFIGNVRMFLEPSLGARMLCVHREGVDQTVQHNGGRMCFKAVKEVAGITHCISRIFTKIFAPKVEVNSLTQRSVYARASNYTSEFVIDLPVFHQARLVFGERPWLKFVIRHIDLLVEKAIVA